MKSYLFVSFLLAISFSSTLFAQGYDIEGFIVDQPLTKAQIIQKFGQPDRYISYEGSEGGLGESLVFGNNDIRLDNGILTDFVVADTTMAVCTLTVPGGIKVGMHASVMDNTVYGPIKSYTYNNSGTTETAYYVGNYDFLLYFVLDDDRFITSIFFAYPM